MRSSAQVSGQEASTTTSIHDVLRSTADYSTAFNVGLWKAQQHRRFHAQLQRAKEAMEHRVKSEFSRQKRHQLSELEATRRELEVLAQRLQEAGDALQERSNQLERQEAAFEARRTQVAEQHEAHLLHTEEKARRAVDEVEVERDALRTRLRTKENDMMHLKERLRCVEAEYDLLRRRTARQAQQGSSVDGARVRDLEAQVGYLTKSLGELQDRFARQAEELERTARARDSADQAARSCRQQVEVLTQHCRALQNKIDARERRELRAERERLEESRRAHEVAAARAGGPLRLRSDVVGAYVTASNHRLPGGNGSGSRDADLRVMLGELQREVEAGLRAQAIDGRTVPYVAATAPASSSLQASHHRERHEQPLIYAEHPAQPPAASPPPTTVDAAVQASPSLSSLSTRRDDADDAAQELTLTDVPPYTEVDQWHTSADEAVSRQSTTLPPLPPAHPANAPPPLPEDFVQAAAAGQDSVAATLADMQNFVYQLKVNRQKLLDTGVYTEEHSVIGEMSRKISLYESYMRQHR